MRVLAFDTETTRLPVGTRQPEIVQLGMISFDDTDRVLDERVLNELINPDVPLDHWGEESIKVHGINPSDVADKPTLSGLAHKIFRVAVGAEILLGYNLPFDVGVLSWDLKRHDLEHHFPWPLTHVDVQDMAMEALVLTGRAGQKPPSLAAIYEHLFGEPLKGAHDALTDIRATIRVWDKLR